MNIVLTDFAEKRHFDPLNTGTVITNWLPDQFVAEIQKRHEILFGGYAPFCKLIFVENFTDAPVGTMRITPLLVPHLRSGYEARTDEELPVLSRWLEIPAGYIPEAEFLCLVLYDKEQLAKEGTYIGDADYGIVAILGQMEDKEQPMVPVTAMRNALGVDEGGSGSPIDREYYRRSVKFWNDHAIVKAV